MMSCLMLFGTIQGAGLQAFAEDADGSNQTTYQVKFVTEPSDAKITVKDGSNKEIKPSENDKNIYKLNNGSYTYSASAEGYDSITDKSFKVEKSQDIKVELSKKNSSDSPVAAMLKGNQPLKAGAKRGALSLDDVRINSFKIIDVANGNKEIDYRTSDSSDYASFSANPSKFSNAVCEGQKNSKIKLALSIEYKSDNAIKEGDTLTIPAKHGGRITNFASKKLFDGTNHQIGNWEYKDGKVIITFSGDYIKNNSVKQFTASFETGEVVNYLSDMGKTSVNGERRILNGVLGKNKLIAAGEKEYVVSQSIGESESSVYKSAPAGSDSFIGWRIGLFSDFKRKDISGKKYPFHNPYILENNGKYSPKALTNIYIEDTYIDCTSEPTLSDIKACISGIDYDGKVIAGDIVVNFPKDAVKKIDQGSKTKEQVKNALKNGEYCMYDNHDGTYTLMMKWWDMNDSSGFTYDKIPAIKEAGGVGSYLKKTYPDVYGSLKSETIEKINQIYRDKAVQNTLIDFHGHYTPVLEKTEVPNTANITTKQTGEKTVSAIGVLTPSAGIADAPADPLAIKMLKTDKDTGENLSTGFKFVLQTSTDNGATWTDVSVNASMLEKGTLDGGQLVPDDKGTIQVKQLIGGNMYRFVEKTHAKPYQDVTINNAKPNDKNNTTSANSKAVKVTNHGKGHVIVMYNAKVKTSVNVEKKWEGPKKDSVTIQLLAGGTPVQGKTLTLSEAVQWKGAFKNLDKLDANGNEIKYDVAEVKIDGYTSTKTGSAANGFIITNKNTEKTKVKVTKKWEGPAKDSVTVKLLADGKEVSGKTLELKKAENWTGTFTDLPKYNKDGSEIKYDVAEVNIAFYDSVKSGDAKNGYVITNKHVPPKKEVFKGTTTTKIDGEVVQPGQELTYAITYKNTKDKDVTAEITDKLPKHTKFVSADNGGTESGGVVTWKPEVKKGESITVKVVVKVDENVNGAPIDNIAKVNDGVNEFNTNETHNPTPTEPKKEVFKGGTTTKIDGKLVQPEEELTYAITYTNTTGKDVNATIIDKLPKHTSFVSAENGGTESGGTVTWNVAVPKGESKTVKFTVKVDKDVNGAPIDNVAKVNDGVNDYKTNETHNPTPTEPKKEVFKGGTTTKIDGKVVQPEEELTYEITYNNTTGKDVNATITDKIPAHTKFVSAENGGTEAGGVVTWNVAVPKGESKTVKFTVKVDKDVNGAPIDNVAKVNDGVNSYDTNETHNPTPTEPKKEVFKGGTTTNIDGKKVEPGQELTYAITYKNTTGKDVTATITDKLPKHTSFVSAENGGTESGGTVKWTVAVAKDQSVTVKFTVKVDADVNGAPIDNVAKVNDGNNDYNTNEIHNPTSTEPKKEVFKGGTTTNIDGKRVEPGQELTYAITYKNTTGKDVNAKITDKIPAHTKFVSAENGGTESSGVVTWNVAVAKDKSVTVKFTVKVDKNVNGTPIDNIAKVNDGNNDYNTNETHNPTPTGPKKEVFKGGTTTNIDGKRVEPEQELTYAITYKNTTGKDVTATITDKIPAHTKFVSADNGGAESGGVVTWNVAVAKDKSVTVKFTVKVDKNVNGAPIDNTARVNDGTNTYDTNETHNPTPTEPKKEVFKGGTTTNIDGKLVQPEQELTYAITYKNTTGKDVNATITDKIPAHTKFVSADNGGKFANGKITWTAKVADGQTLKVTFTVKVDKNVNGEILKNTAIVNDGVNDFNTNTVKNPTPKIPENPDTGDFNNIMLLMLMLLGSSGALVSGMAIRRRREE